MRTESPARRDLRQRLVEEIDELDRYQRVVLVAEGNLVIVAGPGSGKTRTVVARASYLLSARISPLRGLATITYTNQAAIGLKGCDRTPACGSRRGGRLRAAAFVN
jgi:UvrD/REP helicase N-terminal domain